MDDDGVVDADDEDDDDLANEEEEEEDEDEYDEEDDLIGESIQNLVPIEFAKAHIAKIEQDMENMHERHVKLMREMDENYKMIEKET